jgi:hypothetical protein
MLEVVNPVAAWIHQQEARCRRFERVKRTYQVGTYLDSVGAYLDSPTMNLWTYQPAYLAPPHIEERMRPRPTPLPSTPLPPTSRPPVVVRGFTG